MAAINWNFVRSLFKDKEGGFINKRIAEEYLQAAVAPRRPVRNVRNIEASKGIRLPSGTVIPPIEGGDGTHPAMSILRKPPFLSALRVRRAEVNDTIQRIVESAEADRADELLRRQARAVNADTSQVQWERNKMGDRYIIK